MLALARLTCIVLFATALAAQTPTPIFSTFLGVADCDGIALGANGDVYLACHSPSNHLSIDAKPPKPPAFEDDLDAYVLRLNPKSGKLIYATRVGGSAYDEASRIKVDKDGFAYVVGFTKSHDFPATANALQTRFGGGDSDAFLLKVAPNGQIVYATFIGGNGADQGDALALDDKGDVYVGGTTWSNDFPGQSTARMTSNGDAFVVHIDFRHPKTFHSVVFGGQKEEKLTGIALDGRGGLFAVGYTQSRDFPTVKPIQAAIRGKGDLFLTRFAVPKLTLTFSTFFGGSGDDSGWGITVDSRGFPVVAGITDSKDLPTSRGAYQRTNGGGLDAFVAIFEGKGYDNVRSTYFGGSGDDSSGYDGDDIKIDQYGNVWLVGLTTSRDLPTRDGLQPEYGGGDGDGFLVALSRQLTTLCYGTYRGGKDRDFFEGLDVSNSGLIYATGLTWSPELPMFANAIQRELAPVAAGGKFVNATLLGLQIVDSRHAPIIH
jgi:hypothetical protein